MNAANYSSIVPSNMIGVERVRAATHGLAVFLNRVILHYERKDLGLPELPRLALPDGDAAAESLKSHLVPKKDTARLVRRWHDRASAGTTSPTTKTLAVRSSSGT